MHLPACRSMLRAIAEDAEDDPDFVDWFEATYLYGRVVDAACRRHWVDPTEPLHATVLAPAHGGLVTSATLAAPSHEDPFAIAEMRTGAARLAERPRTLRLASPFDYGQNALALVVRDVARDYPRQAAGGRGAPVVHRPPPPPRRAREARRPAGRQGPRPLRPARRSAGRRRSGRHL